MNQLVFIFFLGFVDFLISPFVVKKLVNESVLVILCGRLKTSAITYRHCAIETASPAEAF